MFHNKFTETHGELRFPLQRGAYIDFIKGQILHVSLPASRELRTKDAHSSCALIIAHFRALFKACGVCIQTCIQKAITLVLVGLQKSMTYQNALEFHDEFISELIEDIFAGVSQEKLSLS